VTTSAALVARGTEGQRLTAGATAGGGRLALLLSGIGVYGVVAFAVAIGVLLAVVLLASAVPARRASGVDPIEALRHE
jgi:ABC-type lipoprotein release transport system permease subunit